MLIAPFIILGTVLVFTHDKKIINKKMSKTSQATNQPSNVATPNTQTKPGNAKLILEPNSGSIELNQSLSVKLYEDSGNEEIISVDVGLKYDSTKLEFINIDSKDSKLQQLPNDNSKKGLISVTGFIFPPETLTGKQLIATINFKVIASSDKTTITFLKENNMNGKTLPLLKSAIFSKKDVVNIWDQKTDGSTFYGLSANRR